MLAAAEEDDQRQAARIAALRSIETGRKGNLWALRDRGLRIPQATWWHALLGLGCRYGELRQVRWCDLDLAQRALTLRAETTKGNRERRVPIHADLAARCTGARVWGPSAKFAGQHVGRSAVLRDGDVVEVLGR